MGLFSSSSFFDGNPDLFWVKNSYSYKGPQYDSSISRSRLKFSLNSVIPMVDTGQSRSRSYNFVLAHFLNLEGPFQSVMIFLTSIDPLKSMVTIRYKCFLLFSCFLVFCFLCNNFHQNDDIVHIRSLQRLAGITYASHGNDFLSSNFDHGQT